MKSRVNWQIFSFEIKIFFIFYFYTACMIIYLLSDDRRELNQIIESMEIQVSPKTIHFSQFHKESMDYFPEKFISFHPRIVKEAFMNYNCKWSLISWCLEVFESNIEGREQSLSKNFVIFFNFSAQTAAADWQLAPA